MVNAGAIVTTGAHRGVDRDADSTASLDMFGRFAGRRLAVDEAVFPSERATGDRNRALAYLMKSFGMLDGDVDEHRRPLLPAVLDARRPAATSR